MLIATNANGRRVVDTCTVCTVSCSSWSFFVCCSALCNHSLTCVWVHAHQAEIGCSHFANPTEFQLHITEAQVQSYVRRSDPKSLLHFQEPPLEWQRGGNAPVECHVLPPCMMAVAPSVAVSQYIDIYIVFPLGCSQGAQGGWSPWAVAGRIINAGGWFLYVWSHVGWVLVNRSLWAMTDHFSTLRFN